MLENKAMKKAAKADIQQPECPKCDAKMIRVETRMQGIRLEEASASIPWDSRLVCKKCGWATHWFFLPNDVVGSIWYPDGMLKESKQLVPNTGCLNLLAKC